MSPLVSLRVQRCAYRSCANIGPGNAQGNIILFEPSTSEHLSARTIFDPITALAPASDCRTFAIGYLNGSILIATLQPSFTILHTLTTPRQPSPLAGLAWHGSSSKQKSEMLAAQTSDGDLRVWSVPKAPHGSDAPCVIRVLNQKEQREPGPCWFAWSKNGRIVQYTEGYVSTQSQRLLNYADIRHVAKHVPGMYAPREYRMSLCQQQTASQPSATTGPLPHSSPSGVTPVSSNMTLTPVTVQRQW